MLWCLTAVFSQEVLHDSVRRVNLEEVIVVNRRDLDARQQEKPLSAIDAYLEQSSKVSMIKRGNYAWEPSLHNMVSDRIAVTIDGMQVFGACTDKMDPASSYIDISNLSAVHISSGQQGAANSATIGGGIDFKLKKCHFDSHELALGVDTGYETNGKARIISTQFNFSDQRYFVHIDAMHRKSENYQAGGQQEVLFSQFEKYNISTVFGVKTGKYSAITGTLLFDNASDIGYPALPMDVSLAKALITSLAYRYVPDGSVLKEMETKLFFNTVTHVMDDTKRPVVPIHMDMPGWTNTVGFYAKVHLDKSDHQYLVKANAYHYTSLAEMTMYPNNPGEQDMFMLTWPDLRTTYAGLYGEDQWHISERASLNTTARLGYQHEYVASSFGLGSLQIFYPEMGRSQDRLLANMSVQLDHRFGSLQWLLGTGYGMRAPTVSEAYGFYLFNSFDNYDYLGNPSLKVEKSLEFNTALNYKTDFLALGAAFRLFHLSDYIIGQVAEGLDQMTIGAKGLKIYSALSHANMLHSTLTAACRLAPTLRVETSLNYHKGRDYNKENLPLISPLSYRVALQYKKHTFQADLSLSGAAKQQAYSPRYGEDPTPAYTVVGATLSNQFYQGNHTLFVKAGVENIFDRYYSTFSDWNNIPRMGRNIFVNLSYRLR